RIILTKDRLLYSLARKYGLEAVFVEDSRVEITLSKLSREYGISLEFDPHETRCPACNSLLKMKESEGGNEWTCINCGKHYWMGSHWKNISKIFEEAKKIGGEA
ncbi:MAG: Mut7-C RNAse domain-containing protein, partial [Nitrososphaerota archaeon]